MFLGRSFSQNSFLDLFSTKNNIFLAILDKFVISLDVDERNNRRETIRGTDVNKTHAPCPGVSDFVIIFHIFEVYKRFVENDLHHFSGGTYVFVGE